MNVAQTVARALSAATVVSVDVADVFRERMRLPGRGAGRGSDGPSPHRLPARPAVLRRHTTAAPADCRDRLRGSV
ncbi:hypothetical protein UK14_04275 [Streptomyces sp. NRRL F-4428]|nr:hypothetical protein BSL84_02250 [Streptomyces sp. TN58]KJK53893.1 hypothetical protein UK14_04275 [Streptomyces sp. NRRL F-4428]